jgi:hypothetical protein
LVLVISDRGTDRRRVRDASLLAAFPMTAWTGMLRSQPLERRAGRVRSIRSPGTSPGNQPCARCFLLQGNQPCARCFLLQGNQPRARSYLFQATSPRTQPQKQIRSKERA